MKRSQLVIRVPDQVRPMARIEVSILIQPEAPLKSGWLLMWGHLQFLYIMGWLVLAGLRDGVIVWRWRQDTPAIVLLDSSCW